MSENRKSSLTTLDWYRLNEACRPIRVGLGACTYLVGTANSGGTYRDVDVRTILGDEEFDRLFRDKPEFWSLLCSSIAMRLVAATGLPIDYQVQRMTEANVKYPDGNRNPLGLHNITTLAGSGDATRFAGVGG